MFLLFNFPCYVRAATSLKSETVKSMAGDEVGTITLYDDYTIIYKHLYRVKDISITICVKGYCEGVKPQIVSTNSYDNQEEVSFSISDYLIKQQANVTYVIKATGNFRQSENSLTSIISTLNHEVTIGDIEESNGDKENEVLSSLDNAKAFCRMWIIPGIYLIIALTIVVKGILLAIDITKHSDSAEVRKEKIRAFIYLFIAMVAVALINTSVGWVVGLFD